ncbi:hypothetical protein [Nonomuraea dietziae]|uniref:hypothetical protein n=1 Tax=Nonomuraea dietziae TaxID=65515 RepID=UPI0033C2C299
MVFAVCMPALCWIAPEMPAAMYSCGETALPVWPQQTLNLMNDDPDGTRTAAAWAADHLRDGEEWVSRLQHAGIPSGISRTITNHVFTYAWPTLLSKIQTREIVSDCNTRLGRAVLTLTPDEHEVLRASADERGDLAVHILLDAIDPYLLKLHDGTWQPGRASLPTYFVGACIDERSRGLKSRS